MYMLIKLFDKWFILLLVNIERLLIKYMLCKIMCRVFLFSLDIIKEMI